MSNKPENTAITVTIKMTGGVGAELVLVVSVVVEILEVALTLFMGTS